MQIVQSYNSIEFFTIRKLSDTTAETYGLPVRSFKSFFPTSEEVAVSRLYGGIHYDLTINNGGAQGEEVGQFIVNSIQMTK